jgi:hypothetical protein
MGGDVGRHRQTLARQKTATVLTGRRRFTARLLGRGGFSLAQMR